jgi:hypothetical protein
MALRKLASAPDSYTANVVATPRSQQVRVTSVSKKRFNEDYQYLGETPLRANASNDEIFNASYKQQGLSGKIQTPNKNSNTVDKAANEPVFNTPTQTQSRGGSAAQKIIRADKKETSTALKLIAKTKASTINASIMVWGGSLWFTVQLPFAIISLIMLGIAGTVKGATQASGILGWAATVANKIVEGAAYIVGIDTSLTAISTSFFTVTYLLILAIGLICIFAAFLQYTLAFLKPLSGEMAGLKQGTFLLVLFGYSTPLLNIFPWILLWMAVVWKYPK